MDDRIGLTKEKWYFGDFIFPEKLELIPGYKNFNEVQPIYRYAREWFREYKKKKIDLYVCAGVATELLAVMKAFREKQPMGEMQIYHADRERNYEYFPQKLTWTPQKKENGVIGEFCIYKNRHIGLNNKPSVFAEEETDMFHFEAMEKRAEEVLTDYKGGHLVIYPTGLKQGIVAVLNVAAKLKCTVTFMIYDKGLDEYKAFDMD